MSKSLKIFLAVLALISFGLSLSIVFDWNPFIKIKNQLMPKPSPAPTQENAKESGVFPYLLEKAPEGFTITSPVDKKYLDLIFTNEVSPQSYSFLLDSGELIKAVFPGKITKIFHDQKPSSDVGYSFEEIKLESTDGQFQASYYLLGDVLVKENDVIKEDTVLAKIKDVGADFKSGINFTFSLFDNKEGKVIKLTKEIFK